LKCGDENLAENTNSKLEAKSEIKSEPKAIVKNTTVKKAKPVFIYHTVQPGDTLWRISQRYQLNIDELKKVNNISGTNLKKGAKIKIPVKG
jgi:LysM repeat protein